MSLVRENEERKPSELPRPDEDAAVLRMIADLPPEARQFIVIQEPADGEPLVETMRCNLSYSVTQMHNAGVPLIALGRAVCTLARDMAAHVAATQPTSTREVVLP